MRTVINLLLILSLVFPFPLLADTGPHSSGDSNHIRVEVTIPDATTTATSNDLKELLHEAHESLEGEESGSFVSRWINQFNYKRLFLSAYRWYELKRADPKSRDHALNLVLMLAMSHTIETVGGLTLASQGLHPDTNPFLGAIYGVLGVGITIPGLDPLCLGLMALYWRAPVVMDKALTIPRVVIFKSSSFLARTLGISAVMRWMWESKESKDWLLDKMNNSPAGTYVFEKTVEGYDFSYPTLQGNSPLQVSLIDKGNGEMGLSRLRLNDLKIDGKGLSAWLPLFGGNLKDAIHETVVLLASGKEEELKKKIYFKNLTVEANGSLAVDFKSDSLRLHPNRTLRFWNWTKAQVNSCRNWLASSK